MSYVWQSRVFNPDYVTTDHSTPEQAIAAVEAVGSGSVVKFLLERNLPGCLPEFVHRSLEMWSYDKDRACRWWSHYIFDGTGGLLVASQPH